MAFKGSRSPTCSVYNCTGGKLTYLFNHPWKGGVKSHYPDIPNNKQLSFSARNPEEAVVYRGKNEHGIEVDWMFAWKTNDLPNSVYTMIGEKDYFKTADWSKIYSLIVNDDASDEGNGWKSSISVNGGRPAEVHATLSPDE